MNTPNAAATGPTLDSQLQSIVTISALTATGNLPQLEQAIGAGLDAGLTVNEIKEVLVQLYAYCGFPRSLNGITTLMKVVDERKTDGKNDPVGQDASPFNDTEDKYAVGKKTLETLTGKPDNGPSSGPNAFAPIIDKFLKEHLFADIFSRGVLTYQQRELATISTLASLSGVELQLQAHIGMGMNVGLTEPQIEQAFSLIGQRVSQSAGNSAGQILSKVVDSRKEAS